MLSEANAGRDLADLKVTNRKVGEKILLVIGTKGNSQKIVENASHGQRKGRGRERTDVKFKTQKDCPNVVCLFLLSQKTGVSKSILREDLGSS
jgi:hypothetical protein